MEKAEIRFSEYNATLALGLIFVGIGILLSSVPMQWLGVIVFFMTISVKATNSVKRMTLQDAQLHIEARIQDAKQPHS